MLFRSPLASTWTALPPAPGNIGYGSAMVHVDGNLHVIRGNGTDDRFRFVATGTNAVATTQASDTRWGGTVGAGLEFGFSPNWSAAVEYDHLFMGNRTYAFTNNGVVGPAGTFFAAERIRQDVDLVTVRVNYRWGGPVVAKY